MRNTVTTLGTLIGLATVFLVSACQQPSPSPASISYQYNVSRTIKTVDEIDLTYHLDIPDAQTQRPLMLIIDGSSCRGPKPGLFNIMRPDESAPSPYARLIVEKIGVGLEDDGSSCSDLYLQNYSIEDRVFQHMRALQHIRKTAQWWNGDLLLWGWSDGGDVAARLTAYYPKTKRAVLGGMGGGLTMEEHFKDIISCQPDKFPTATERQPCLDHYTEIFTDIRNNPTWQKTWSGDDNSYKVWETRLFARLSILLADNAAPILIVHGEDDHYATPVQSARKLVADLKAEGNSAYTYWEIKDMGHSFGPDDDDKRRLYLDAMRDWLLIDGVKQPAITPQ
ncbi:MAG: prolyl oligopeptidase family serine peptidase [Robiginitomaculum sp.]